MPNRFPAGSRSRRTGDTIFPSFSISADSLSAALRSGPVGSATFPVPGGSPAFFVASRMMSPSPMIPSYDDTVINGFPVHRSPFPTRIPSMSDASDIPIVFGSAGLQDRVTGQEHFR